MNALAILHVLAAVALPLAAIAGVYRSAPAPGASRLALAAAAAGLVVLVTGALRQRAFEAGYRRAVYLASHSAGEWLDRKTHLGFAACCFAVAAALAATERSGAPRWLARALYLAAAAFALGAFVLLAFVHARVPTASLE